MNANRPSFTRAAVVLSLAVVGCHSSAEPAVGNLRVLFIGNSLTYVNDLPAMVAEFSQGTPGTVSIDVTDVSKPDYALEDHWRDSRTTDVLDQGGWDVVVLQQGPSSLPENQVNLRDWAGQFAERIRAHGGRPALFMVWPDSTRLSFFDAVRASYDTAAQVADGDFYPAGEAWRAAWRLNGTLALYGSDGFHPSLLGSYVAALTVYEGLTGRSPIGLPAPSGIAADDAVLAQRAADEAWAAYGRRGN